MSYFPENCTNSIEKRSYDEIAQGAKLSKKLRNKLWREVRVRKQSSKSPAGAGRAIGEVNRMS